MHFKILTMLMGAIMLMAIDLSRNYPQHVMPSEDKLFNGRKSEHNLKLGAFSISLSVKDLQVSKVFYETIGFHVLGGSISQNYLIMKNENALVGLFQGMFEGNILTFNPGWDENARNISEFVDIREIQRHLKSADVEIISEADSLSTGPASVLVRDPDGNLILIDQHR